MNANLIAKANQIIKTCDTAYFGSIDDNGYPVVTTVSVIKPEGVFEAYFSTGLESGKVARLSKNNKASLCFKNKGDNITLVGEAEILTDQEIKSRYWLDWFINHYSSGKTDPSYCIIKLMTKYVNLWLGDEGAVFSLDEQLTV